MQDSRQFGAATSLLTVPPRVGGDISSVLSAQRTPADPGGAEGRQAVHQGRPGSVIRLTEGLLRQACPECPGVDPVSPHQCERTCGCSLASLRLRILCRVQPFQNARPSLWAVTGQATEDLDHLPIAIIAALQFAADRALRGWQHPIPERGAIAQSDGFASQNRDIVPRIMDSPASSKGAGMVADDHGILSEDDPIRIGTHIDRPPDGGCDHGILVVVEPHGAGLQP